MQGLAGLSEDTLGGGGIGCPPAGWQLLYASPMSSFLCCPLTRTMLFLWGVFLSNVVACLLLPQALFYGEPRNSLPGLAT